MNFDEIKKQWDQQAGDLVQVRPASLQKTQSILETIRKNFKRELIYTSIALIFLLTIPFYEDFHEVIVIVYYLIILQVVLITISHFKNIHRITRIDRNPYILNSKENLQQVYYELKYTIELQRRMIFFMAPLSTMIYFILIGRENAMQWFSNYYHFTDTLDKNPWFFVWNLLGLATFLAFVMYRSSVQIEKRYGTPLTEIKSVLEDIEE
ncbi:MULTISPECIES: hypothetical protein [Sphingobacterium]|uniref:DUF3278 domain-containing protein n=1 Tax=Sphingobacterium populi TaxID=1812824 RepID=A0ABW5UCH9_9SPHI|nr:hypothetical protein [Sphingobacterium sp. CFCC 11742]